MPESYEAGVRFVATDEGASATVAKMSTHIERTTEKMRQVIKQTGYLQLALKRIAIYTAIFTFFGTLTKLIGEAISLETRLAEVSTLVNMRNKEMAESFRVVTGDLMALSPYLGAATDLTKGLYEIMSAGVTEPAEAFKLLVVSAKYAKAGITDLATAASSLTAIMKAYGYAADEMREKSDMLFASVMEGKYHAEELNDAIGKILPTAAMMEVHIDEVSAALAVLTQRGLDVREAATGLNRMMLALLRPMDKSKKLLEKLGIEYGRNAFMGKGLVGVLRQIIGVSKRYGDILPEIFRRQRALKVSFVLAGEGFKDYVRLLQKIRDATEEGGEVSRAYGKMIGTVGAEVKAAGAKMLKVMYELWKGKGFEYLGGFIRLVSSWIAVILKGSRVTLAAVPFIWGLAKAYKAANATLLMWRANTAAFYAMTGRMTKSLYAQGAALQLVTKRARALAGVLMALKVGLVAGVILYIAGKAALDEWINSSDRGIASLHGQTKAMKELRDELNLYAAAAGQAGEVTGNVAKELRDLAKADVLKALRTTTKDIKLFHSIVVTMTKAFRKGSPAIEHLDADVNAFIKALREGQKDMTEFNWIIEVLARNWGYSAKRIKEWIDAQRTNLAVMEKSIGAMRFLSRFQRDWNKIVESSSEHVRGLARALSKEELEDSIKLLGELMELTPQDPKWMLVQAYLKSLGFSLEKLTEKEIPKFKKRLEEALAIRPEVMRELEYEEFMREYLVIFEKMHPPLRALETSVAALADTWTTEWVGMYKDGVKGMTDYVKANQTALKLIEGNLDRLGDVYGRVLVEEMIKFLNKGLTAQEKAARKALALREQLANDFIRIDATMEQMRNELRGEEFNNVVVQTKKLITLEEKKIRKWVELAIKGGEDIYEVWVEAAQKKIELNKLTELAEQVARRRELEEVIKANMQMLQGSFDFVHQRILMARQMYQELKDLVRSWYTAGSEQYNNMMKLVEKFYKKTVGAIEKSTHALQYWVDILNYTSRMLSSLVRALNDFAGHLDITEGFVTRFIDVLDMLAKQAKLVSSSFVLMIKRDESKVMADAAKATAQNAVAKAMLAATASMAAVSVYSLAAAEAAEAALAAQAAANTLSFAASVAVLQAVIGNILAVIMFFVSLLTLVFGKKKTDEVDEMAEAITRGRKALQWFGRVSEDVAKSFDDFKKKFGKAWATVMIMPALLDELAEKPRAIGDAFASLISFAEEFGLEGSAAFAKLIQKVRDLGIHIKELDEYMQKWLKSSVEGLEDMIWGARGLGDELKRLGVIALATFDAMLASGMSFAEALKAMEPVLLALYFGMEDLDSAAAKAIKRYLDIAIIARLNWDLFASIEAVTGSLIALAVAGVFAGESGQEVFSALAGQALEYYNQLRALGLTEYEALQVMAPTLQKLWYYAEEYGLVLDENTQKLIDQAIEYGLIGDEAQSFNDILIAGFDKIIEKLEELIILLGGVGDGLDRIPRRPPWEDWGDLPDGGNGSRPRHVAQFGISNLGQNALIYAHRGESILPPALSEALRQFYGGGLQPSPMGESGGRLVAIISIDGRQFYKAVVPYVKEGVRHGDMEEGDY